MALLWIEGFDGRTAQLTGAYSSLYTTTNGAYVTGRFGSGSAFQSSAANNQYSEFLASLGGAKTTIYTGCGFKLGGSYNGFDCLLFNFVNGSTSVLNLRYVPNNSAGGAATYGTIRVTRGATNVAGTDLGTASAKFPIGAWCYVEMKVTCGTGTAGSVVVRLNGAEILNLTGVDTGSASCDKVGLRVGTGGSGNPTAGADSIVDDWWVCDGTGTLNNNFLGDIRILNVVPTGAGSSTQLTPSAGSNWQCVDEIPPTTADYVGHATAGNKDLYAYADLAGTYTNIRGVKIASLALASDAGLIKGRNLCKSGAATTNGADNTLSATAQIFQDLIELDPNTSAQWSNAAINAAEFGWEVRT